MCWTEMGEQAKNFWTAMALFFLNNCLTLIMECSVYHRATQKDQNPSALTAADNVRVLSAPPVFGPWKEALRTLGQVNLPSLVRSLLPSPVYKPCQIKADPSSPTEEISGAKEQRCLSVDVNADASWQPCKQAAQIRAGNRWRREETRPQ